MKICLIQYAQVKENMLPIYLNFHAESELNNIWYSYKLFLEKNLFARAKTNIIWPVKVCFAIYLLASNL